MGKYYVYVLGSLKDKGLYIGMTSNLEARIYRHNKGWERTTRIRRPFKMVHFEMFETRVQAREREKYFKNGYAREILRQMF
ncbi:MAG: GIY-YIG nuclease family protein [bacterium]|nr:GIY-YIG nuclease family protein [Candidatus Margulisiibacteriota bacterium]